MALEVEPDEAFAGDTLDRGRWLPWYLPRSSRERAAARYEVDGGVLRLLIEADQEPSSTPRSSTTRAFHVYAADWRPDRVELWVDGEVVKVVPQSPAYPMQPMLDIDEFPPDGAPGGAVPEGVPHRLRARLPARGRSPVAGAPSIAGL